MSKKIALFFDRPYIDAHFCFREMIVQFLENGWHVDLFMPFSLEHPLLSLRDDHLRINLYKRSNLKLLQLLKQLSCWGQSYKYRAIIATPQWALYWAVRVGKIFRMPVICLADEVYSYNEKEWSIAQQRLVKSDVIKWKKREAWANQQCTCTIALSEERFSFTKQENQLSDDHSLVVIPNAPSKQPLLKSSFYRETLEIPENKTILLHSGSGAWSLIDKVLEKSPMWSKDIHIVMQGRYRGTLNEKQQSDNVSIAPWVLPAEMMNYATSSVDIGLMLYNRENPEESRNGATAGKLGLYLSCGLPIICCNIDALRWVDTEGCGLWVEDVDDIPSVTQEIMNRYTEFQHNSYRIFLEKFEYSGFFNNLLPYIDSNQIV